LKKHFDATSLLDRCRKELLPFLFCLGIFHLGPLNAGKDLRRIGPFTDADPEKGASVLGRVVDELVIAESPEDELEIIFLLEDLVVLETGLGSGSGRPSALPDG
jgi:hypothetical protein